MSTTQVVAALFQLQQLDLELDHLNAEYHAVLHTLQGNAHLQRLRDEYDHAQRQLQAGLQTQKEAEWALEDITNRLEAQEQRLYSGSVSSKDLQSLQQEVQRLRAQQSRQEEIVIEVLDAAESLQETVDRKLESLKQAEEEWQKESLTLIARRDQIEARQQDLQAKRMLLASSLDAEHLSLYDAMRRMKQGRAISKVEQNWCQWCRVTLTPSELQRVRISTQLQTCNNCGRILYYDR